MKEVCRFKHGTLTYYFCRTGEETRIDRIDWSESHGFKNGEVDMLKRFPGAECIRDALPDEKTWFISAYLNQ